MNYKYLLVVAAAFLLAACSATETTKTDDIDLTEDAQQNTENPGLGPRAETAPTPEEIVLVNGKSESKIRAGRFGTEIRTMTDGHGNKTELRIFRKDEPIKMLVVRTRADGERQVLVHGHNGEAKELSGNQAETLLISSAQQIADLAGIRPPVKKKTHVATNQGPVPEDNLFPVEVPESVEAESLDPPQQPAPVGADEPRSEEDLE